MIGHTLDGRYAIRSRIARGGMAMVYLANDLRLERRVAVKIMHAHLADDENFRRRFDQEARSAARLSHPNLVNVFDQGFDADRNYLVMEYLPSITLRDLLKQQHSLTREQTLEISEAILAGLSAAHHAGIVHRDLKPENVLLADDGRIKLGDFGLARSVSANTTTGQALLGTIAYLSPELVTRGIAGARSDLYAFGIMLYEMLTGVQPFTGEQPMQIAYQHAHSDVPVPSLVSDESTPELDDFVRWLTRRDPEDRPLDAGAALVQVRAIIDGTATAIAPPAATTVLPSLAATTRFTPSTAVLDDAQLDALAGSPGDTTTLDAGESEAAETPIDRAADAAHRRKRRGLWLAAIAVVAIALAAGAGWWFGQGPGSQATVPDVAGASIEEALTTLSAMDLTGEVTQCSSLDIEVGLAVNTDPEAGSRVDRGTTVQLCESSGPELLSVPTLVGLSQDDAQTEIERARFTFGSVVEERFSSEEAGLVLAALGENGEPLGETYPEQGTVDLVVSAGALPDVVGQKQGKATATLKSAGLIVDEAQIGEAHDPEIPKGSVIAVVYTTDPVRPGDTVGLTVSIGPELFPVPDVAGMGLQEAMDALAAAGFAPTTLVPDALRNLAKATGTDPEAGAELPAGAEIRVKSTISL
ncbi:Stk1 family PASTA domain-containing Ser/Thr kinase [Leucobacter salsicius]